MKRNDGTIGGLRRALDTGTVSSTELARRALAGSNGSASRNTYLWQDPERVPRAAEAADRQLAANAGRAASGDASLLRGLPVSVKDCFDLAGAPTSCGVRYYRDLNGNAARSSWLVERLEALGAVIVGKTHLHPLAYGITGENPEFGDCVQPRDAGALTGGSSSGAAASVQEGSAVLAFGTDTGGSIRVPAALCGLVGYRASIGRGDWRGGSHLAESFDTLGCLFVDLEDAPLLGGIFSGPAEGRIGQSFSRFAVIEEGFLSDCEPAVVESLNEAAAELAGLGLRGQRFEAGWWGGAFEIFAPIQASEAARIHAGHYGQFDPELRERLEWGAGLTAAAVAGFRMRHEAFKARMDGLADEHQLLLLPATPTARFAAGADHSQTRSRLLRYTTPVSLAGMPVVTVPGRAGGVQLVAARGRDEDLLDLAARIGRRRKRFARSLGYGGASGSGGSVETLNPGKNS